MANGFFGGLDFSGLDFRGFGSGGIGFGSGVGGAGTLGSNVPGPPTAGQAAVNQRLQAFNQQLQRRALTQGLLQGGAALLQAGGPSRVPTSFGEAFGQGLVGFGQGAQQGVASGQNQAFRGLQTAQLQQQLAQSTAQQQARQQLIRQLAPQGDDTGPSSPPFGLTPERAELARALLPVAPNLATQLLLPQEGKARTLSATEKKDLGIPANVVVQQRSDGSLDVAFKPAKEPRAQTPINVLLPDASVRAFRPGDPQLDAALAQGGTIVSQRAQAETPGALRGGRADVVQADVDAIGRARTKISEITKGIEANRGRAGVTGTIAGLFQRGAGMLVDVVDALPGVELGGFVADTVRDVERDLTTGTADAAIGGLFDPELPANQVRENSLAYALARARKGTGRLNLQDVENARGDVSITGLKSTDEVLTRLKEIDREFAEAEEDRKSRLRGRGRGRATGRPRFRIENGRLVPVQ